MSERGSGDSGDGRDSLGRDELRDYVQEVMDWTSYQATAYVTVVRNRGISPKEIVARTEIPQGRIYDVLRSLEGVALNVQRRQPKIYEAQHPRSLLGEKQEVFNEMADAAIGHLEQLHEIQRERDDPSDPAWVISGLAGTKREILDALQAVEEEVCIVDRDGSWIQSNERRDLGRMASRGVDVQVVGQSRWRDNLATLVEEYDVQGWQHEALGTSFLLFDNELAIMRIGRGETGVKLEDAGTVKVLRTAFDTVRQEATRIQSDA